MKKIIMALWLTAITATLDAETKLSYIFNDENSTATVTYNGEKDEWMLNPELLYSGNIVIPETVVNHSKTYTVTAIGESAFAGGKDILSISIPKTVTSIGNDAFSMLNGLQIISVDNANPNFFVYSGSLYSKTPLKIFYTPRQLAGDVTIYDGVTEISSSAFQNCEKITSVTIPQSVVKIADGAFASCAQLQRIYGGENVQTISVRAFFQCYNLTEIDFSKKLSSIDVAAFFDCRRLAKLVLRSNPTVEKTAFDGCISLNTIYNLSSATLSAGAETYGKMALYVKKIYTSENPTPLDCSATETHRLDSVIEINLVTDMKKKRTFENGNLYQEQISYRDDEFSPWILSDLKTFTYNDEDRILSQKEFVYNDEDGKFYPLYETQISYLKNQFKKDSVIINKTLIPYDEGGLFTEQTQRFYYGGENLTLKIDTIWSSNLDGTYSIYSVDRISYGKDALGSTLIVDTIYDPFFVNFDKLIKRTLTYDNNKKLIRVDSVECNYINQEEEHWTIRYVYDHENRICARFEEDKIYGVEKFYVYQWNENLAVEEEYNLVSNAWKKSRETELSATANAEIDFCAVENRKQIYAQTELLSGLAIQKQTLVSCTIPNVTFSYFYSEKKSPTETPTVKNSSIEISTVGNNLIVEGAEGKTLHIFNAVGQQLDSFTLRSNTETLQIHRKGFLLLQIEDFSQKVFF